jgi:triosephosphate isomerase
MGNRIIVANWKMNLTRSEGLALTDAIVKGIVGTKNVTTILAVPFPFLAEVGERIANVPNLHLAAQNCSAEENGAFTGEISAQMLKSFGVEYVVVGHSERRLYFGERGLLLCRKMEVAIAHGLTPIFCCGEDSTDRKNKKQFPVVKRQLSTAALLMSEKDFSQILIAYEPVWAIGTGQTATAAQAEEMHEHIYQVIYSRFATLADRIPILYGGSVKPSNAAELFSQPHIHGALVGGASLLADDFLSIVKA